MAPQAKLQLREVLFRILKPESRFCSYLSLLILVLRIVLTHSEEDIVLDRLQDFREDLGKPFPSR